MATDSMLRPGELKSILLREIEAADLGSMDVNDVGTVLEVKDGVALIYGLRSAMAGEMLEFTARETGEVITGLVLNLEQDSVGAAIMGDYLKLKEGDEVRCTGRLLEVPVGPVTARSRRRRARPPGRRDGSDRGHHRTSGRVHGARHHRPQAGARADADRCQGDRLDDPDRPWPARADHRRPRHRQDGDRDRHDHQPEGHRRHLRVRRDRPEALDGCHRGREAEGGRRDGLHHRRRRIGVRSGAAPVHRAVHRHRARRVLHVRRGEGDAVRVRRPVEAGRCVPADVADPPPPAGS